MSLHQTDLNPLQTASILTPQMGLPVAQYVRMSTELQCYSTQNQMAAIADYAKAHGMFIARTFADEGKSGLRLDRRPGLLALLAVVQSGLADFKAILVYDVSRWGRFQDTDESGYWEYICKRAGVKIHYCAEPFANDESLPSVIFKSIKRTMAAEYSRELSVKVFAGQSRLVELGYRQGGLCGYGLRRMLLDQEHRPKGILLNGARKSLQTDRVVLVPGPEREQRIVQEIYRSFVEEGKTQIGIANDLNARGIDSGNKRPWSSRRIHNMLTNPKYIGANVYNRTSLKLSQRVVANPEPLWIRRDGAFVPIVSTDLFDRAKRIFDSRRPTDEEMLTQVRSLLSEKGRLSGRLIDLAPGMPSQSAFSKRFRGLKAVYERVGYIPHRSLSYVDRRRSAEAARLRCLKEFASQLRTVGASAVIDFESGVVQINGDFTVLLTVSQCCMRPDRRWWISRRSCPRCDLRIMARMNVVNDSILDYYLFPRSDGLPDVGYLRPQNSVQVDAHRFQNLDQVCDCFRRERVGDLA